MPKSVARASDMSATPGSGPQSLPSGAASGTWAAGSITTQTYDELVVGGAAVVYQAKVTFSFTGVDGSGNTYTPTTSDVTLNASATKLQGAESGVLVDGDSAQDTYGNKLSVSSSSKARTD